MHRPGEELKEVSGYLADGIREKEGRQKTC